jgi:hypothetical protein
MPKPTITFDTLCEVARNFPGVEQDVAYGKPALKLNGQILACVPAHRSAEPGSVVIRVDIADRNELLAAAPDTYYAPGHYRNHSSVLVRLDRLDRGMLRDLLGMAYKFLSQTSAAKTKAKRKTRR